MSRGKINAAIAPYIVWSLKKGNITQWLSFSPKLNVACIETV
jgi:hypothetical protein